MLGFFVVVVFVVLLSFGMNIKYVLVLLHPSAQPGTVCICGLGGDSPCPCQYQRQETGSHFVDDGCC